MFKYIIKDAVSKADGAKTVNYLDYYDDCIEFEAENDNDAIHFAAEKQAEHDNLMFGNCSEDDFVNAPTYLSHLYRLDDEDNLSQIIF